MSADPDQAVARVAERSRLAAAGRWIAAAWREATARSMARRTLVGIARQFAALAAAERIRLAGVLLLAATITNAVLLQWTPEMVRPAAPGGLRLEVAAAALVLIVFARGFASAWQGSRVRRMLWRGADSSNDANGS